MTREELYSIYLQSGGISTDTRTIPPGALFFALKGGKHDGNVFAMEAVEKGACLAVVDDAYLAAKSKSCLAVQDVLVTLQGLAQYHRGHLKIPVIGLTGSNGKTTTKELVGAVLSQKFNTFATQGNLNNHIGVPLSLLSIGPSVEIAVIEMGANHLGEIARLCEIAKPDHGFITNISKAHVGPFGGMENVLRAKSELYQHLIVTNGTVWINHNDPILMNMAKRFRERLLYPRAGDFYSCELLGADPFLKVRAENGQEVTTHLFGKYNFDNVAVALCIGKYFGVDASAANRAAADYSPANMRSQLVRKGTNLVILDAYNANPGSMKAAVETLSSMTAARKVAILGDMFELGDESAAEHSVLGRLVGESNIGEVYLCGREMAAAAAELPSAHHFLTLDELTGELRAHPLRDATVLVKGSRGMAMEKTLDFL